VPISSSRLLDPHPSTSPPSLPPSLPTEIPRSLALALLPGHELDPGDGSQELDKGQRALGRYLEGGREGGREGGVGHWMYERR